MSLDAQPKYSSACSYVLKLHRDASPASGAISGLIESILTGLRREFHSGEELVALLARDLDPTWAKSKPPRSEHS